MRKDGEETTVDSMVKLREKNQQNRGVGARLLLGHSPGNANTAYLLFLNDKNSLRK